MDTATKKYGARYPWREWFAAGKVKLKRGKDFDCRADNFGQMARRAARVLGRTLHIEIAPDGESLTIEVIDA